MPTPLFKALYKLRTFATCVEEFAASIGNARDVSGLFEGTIKHGASLVAVLHP